MRIIITIDTDNAAFENTETEVGRILHEYAQQLLDGCTSLRPIKLYDVNGNTVGQIELKEDEPPSTVRHTACRHCGLDIEGVAPFARGQWRDRGNNRHCNDSRRVHAPVND